MVLWGHSLGTGIGCRLAEVIAATENESHLSIYTEILAEGSKGILKGVFLEAPFESLTTAADSHFCGSFLWLFPKFIRTYIMEKIIDLCDKLASIERIRYIHTPVMIVHARDDWIISLQQGINLASKLSPELGNCTPGSEVAIADGTTVYDKPCRLTVFPYGGHNNIGFHPKFTEVVGDFIINIEGFQ